MVTHGWHDSVPFSTFLIPYPVTPPDVSDTRYSNRDYENPLQHLVTTCPLNHPIFGATAEIDAERFTMGARAKLNEKLQKTKQLRSCTWLHLSMAAHAQSTGSERLSSSFPFLLLDSYRSSKLRKWAKAFGWWCATACYNIVSRHHLHQTLHLATACCSMLGEVWRADE